MLKRNEAGIAVPGDESQLPWKTERDERVTDECGMRVVSVAHIDSDTLHFISHAANFHERLADIVRRLAIWTNQSACDPRNPNHESIVDISRVASQVWIDMRKDGE